MTPQEDSKPGRTRREGNITYIQTEFATRVRMAVISLAKFDERYLSGPEFAPGSSWGRGAFPASFRTWPGASEGRFASAGGDDRRGAG